jgi:hypothetical protein
MYSTPSGRSDPSTGLTNSQHKSCPPGHLLCVSKNIREVPGLSVDTLTRTTAFSAAFVYVAKVVPPAEVSVGNSCLQVFILLGSVCGAAFSTLIFGNVGKLDVTSRGVILDATSRQGLLRGLRAAYWTWAGLCFFGKYLVERVRDRLCIRMTDISPFPFIPHVDTHGVILQP